MWIDIGKVMNKKGCSQRKLALALGRQPSEVSRFFKPDFDPKISLLLKIADVLEVELLELFNPSISQEDKVVTRPETAVATLKKMGFKEKVVKKTKKKK
jgi:transcriptional regulator with XRE-family HTH domain